MTLEEELQLSWYQEVARIDEDRDIWLVQDVRDRKFYVKKRLTVYHAQIYRHLRQRPVAHTPRIYAAVEEDGVLTVIEEYIHGDTLRELLDREGLFPTERAIDIAAALCRILEEFHSRSPAIVNRDIKPENIKLTPDGVVKLIDLNAAKWCDERQSQDTVLLGTKGYAAPEQYGFGPSGVLTDVYAVGVLLNVLLTDRLPSQELASGPVGKVIRKCVELSPDARYQSAAQLREALEALNGRKPPRGHDWEKHPPGFRTRNLLRWGLSALGYAFLFRIGLSLEVENAGPWELVMNRAALTVGLLAIVFFNGNYLGIRDRVPLTKSPSRAIRWLTLTAVDFGILFVACGIMVLLVP